MVLVIAAATTTLAQPTATLTLTSARNGVTIGQSQPVDWHVSVSMAVGTTSGLAGVVVDFTQAAANPALLDIPTATSVPTSPVNLSDFSRPRGISNGQPGNPMVSTYTGTQVGPIGAKNLLQIGGMQNTFGVAGAVLGGDGMPLLGRDTTIDTGIANGSLVAFASGTFAAPSAPGVYTFTISNGRVNVLTSATPTPTDVAAAVVAYSPADASFSFTVTAACCNADYDGDGDTGTDLDIEAFFACLGANCCPTCGPIDFDCDGDSGTDLDIRAFFRVLGGNPC